MSIRNAHAKAPSPDEIPSPSLSDFAFENGLRAAGRNYSVTLNRRTGRRDLGIIFPLAVDADEWESQLTDLSVEQGLDLEGHSLERQQARGRQDEPTADPATTSRTLRRG